MKLALETQQEIIHSFLSNASFRFPYENRSTHASTNDSTYFAIPVGKKVFVWFTWWNNKETCFLLFRTKERITEVDIATVSASKEIYYGTVLYGTACYLNKRRIVVAEELTMYKGRKIHPKKSLSIIGHCLVNEMPPNSSNKKSIIIALPVIVNPDTFANQISIIPYTISYIQIRNKMHIYCQTLSHWKTRSSLELTTRKGQRHFIVRPDVQNDIYHLHNTHNDTYVGVCAIPDYKSSVFMNTTFRKIKENARLDALEESDSESEFENTSLRKFICASSLKLSFYYHARSRKWAPVV